MTPTFPLSLALGWARAVCVFVVDVGLLAAGGAVGGRSGWCVGAGMAVLITLAALVSWRGAPVLTLAWRSLVAGRATIGVPAGALADHDRTFGTGPVGIRAVGPHLVAVVAVDGQPHSPSALDYPRVITPSILALAAVAAGLRPRRNAVAFTAIDGNLRPFRARLISAIHASSVVPPEGDWVK